MKPIQVAFLFVSAMTCGCSKQFQEDYANWSKVAEVAKSSDSLSASFSLYKWNGTLLTFGGDAGTFAARALRDDGMQWDVISKNDPGWMPMDCDPSTNRIIVSKGALTSGQVEIKFKTCAISPDRKYHETTSDPLILKKEMLFGTSDPNLQMVYGGDRPVQVAYAGGTIQSSYIHIPYCMDGIPFRGKGFVSSEILSANGVFTSTDAGRTWRVERISGPTLGRPPIACRTKGLLYYFALGGTNPNELWNSHRTVFNDSWSPPETLKKTLANTVGDPNLNAVAGDETVHLCWLDRRHEKKRLNPVYPYRENYEVAYCNRKDADAAWNKDVILSDGLLYAYAPSMSVEGNNVVVAWAGVKSDKDGRNEFDPTDIYFVASKDAGKTWRKPMQVTDGFKGGITSGRPQVALHKGVIHLFYIQGKLNFKKTGGAVKLNQPPWPILYQQRPFPK